MRQRAHARILRGGRRLHLQDGPIDLLIEVDDEATERRHAYEAAYDRFRTILDELCRELPHLRNPVDCRHGRLLGDVARRMEKATLPFASTSFITPMAAVAGAVADEVLAAMLSCTTPERAYVNNGGDIALHLAGDAFFRIGLVDRPDAEGALSGTTTLTARDGVGGIATSGGRGRSFSLGIADAVTILAGCAASADAAATIVANAVDLPGHPAIHRIAACDLQPDTDLGDRPVTRAVGRLAPGEVASAIARGAREADRVLNLGLISGAAIQCAGTTHVVRRPAEPVHHRLHVSTRRKPQQEFSPCPT